LMSNGGFATLLLPPRGAAGSAGLGSLSGAEVSDSAALARTASGWRGGFTAMASPCEILVDAGSETPARKLLDMARDEALRIEHKFSRYRSDSVIGRLNAAAGQAVEVDTETAQLLDFAAQCHALSGGLFDVTSGVLRAAWRFDGGSQLPEPALVQALSQRVGWQRVRWQRPWLTLPLGMEIDLGGIGKEYAVDRVLGLLMAQGDSPVLVNFGGDLVVSGPRRDAAPWQVGIERPEAETPGATAAAGVIELTSGALATSGDARRFVLRDGKRYGHILDPRSGWPVRDAPRSVTVAAPTCSEAGVVATMAMLQGANAEAWLAAQALPHWVIRDEARPVPSGARFATTQKSP
ncbi:MAG: FAD:protein FMN transferase, partial [Burkholderiaceae bacterium]